MIVAMSHLTVLCLEKARTQALERLRELGVLHVTAETDAQATGAESLAAAEKALEAAKKAAEIVASLPRDAKAGAASSASPEEILGAAGEVAEIEGEIAALDKEIALYSHFGDFNPKDAADLADAGIQVTLFKAPASQPPAGADGVSVTILSEDGAEKAVYGVMIGAAGQESVPPSCEIVSLPDRPLAKMREELAKRRAALAGANDRLASFAGCGERLSAQVRERTMERDFQAAAAKGGAEGGIAWITGFCPEEALGGVAAAARECGWGFAARAVHENEIPPTLLRPPRLFRPITSLFRMLDIAPGYREVDLSVVFYAFFTLFFAMLVGDFGYGALMLAAMVFFRRKFPKAAPAPFILLGVFSIATCVWGVLSCNYFGAHPKALDFSVPQWLNDPSYTNIMKLCFLLGAIHLSTARLWSAALLWPDTKALAEIGWTGVIWTMFCTSCAVVIPEFSFPKFMFAVAPASILLIFLFMLKREELKTEGINLAILPLNIISCLGDIISYVRLFAVGLASVKVAENFNSMALGMNLPLAVKIPAVALILLLGHGLNLAMGALSILVHAVRLNTLEFSSHKGISWSGYAYDPLRRK